MIDLLTKGFHSAWESTAAEVLGNLGTQTKSETHVGLDLSSSLSNF